ncbi:MAG: T9SS type A sorting domain-containing protein [Flavobacteriales bacterium]|nr:T9SS type A sorting domain-containing protein [Flavobacteriales bacterium]MCB9197690.1 T9SS type A sorting domain-containing protein [Flavobacteriales bacterium]
MRKLLLSITFLSIGLLTMAQAPTQQVIDRTTSNLELKKTVELNGSLYTIGRSNDNDINRIYPVVFKQDQELNTEWMYLPHRGYGYIDQYEVVWSIVPTTDNKLLCSGTRGILGNSGMYYFLMDTLGNIAWHKEMRTGTWGNQLAYNSVPNSIGGALLIGTENGGSPQLEAQFVYVDGNGDTLWTKKIVPTDGTHVWGGSIRDFRDQSGNFISVLQHGNTYFKEVVKFDVNGNVLDQFRYNDQNGYNLSIEGADLGDNCIYYSGFVVGGAYPPFILKTDVNGNPLWCRYYDDVLNFQKIKVTSDGDLLVSAKSWTTAGVNRVQVLKLDENGEFIKARIYGKLPEEHTFSGDILEFNDHYLFTGTRQYQQTENGYQVLLDQDLNSGSCYEREEVYSSYYETVYKDNFPDLIFSSMYSDVLFYGDHSDPFSVGGSNYITYELDNVITTNIEVNGDDCGGSCIGSADVLASGGNPPFNYEWSDGQNGSNASNLCVNDEIVLLTGDQMGCYTYDTIVVPQMTPVNELCLVTVDSTSTKNEVIWEKPISGAIDGFVVHREVAGNYTVVGYVPYDSLSRFIDNTNGVNPNITSYRYKITTLDTCGYESEYSDYHETIHLTVNQGAGIQTNLIWDGYEGFSFSYNRIWKDSLGDDNWVLRDSVSSSVFTWTDIYASTVATEYIIEVVSPSICTAAKAQDYGSTRSNKSTIAGPPAELGLEEMAAVDFTVFPNPFSSFITLKLNNSDEANMKIFDVHGRLVVNYLLRDITNIIELPQLESGVYLLQVESNGVISTQKLVKE